LLDFDYISAKSTPEAIQWLASHQGKVKILAGGTDLLVQLREEKTNPSFVLDVKNIPDLNQIEYDPQKGVVIGAAVPCYHLCRNKDLIAHYPGLIDAISLIGGVQIQGRASLGGNLCNASPAADSIPALIVHNASLHIAGLSGHRQVAVDNFCLAPGKTILNENELLISIILPPPVNHFGAAYLRFIPRNEMDIAVAGSAVSLTFEEDLTTISSIRVALSAVAPTPLLVSEVSKELAGKEMSLELINTASRLAAEAARPITDMRGTEAQRKHLAAVLTKRAMMVAIERARK
jgi:xanthine dehydrogenase FAD-binding subunit